MTDIGVTPADLWSSWNLHPVVLAAIAAVAGLYWSGVRALWSRGGHRAGRGVGRRQVVAFACGLFALCIALISPVDALSESLLSAHMAQHLLLLVVAAPLIVIGAPALVVGQSLRGTWTRRLRRWGRRPALRWLGRLAGHPVWSWVVATGVLWAWHIPSLYQSALENPLVHSIEHAGFLAAGMLFWWTALRPAGPRRLPRGADVVYVFTGALQSGALGALLVFAAAPIYPFYVGRTSAWGLTPLQDQQLAGVLMWVPPFVIYLAAASALFVRWLRAAEAESRRHEARAAGQVGRVPHP